MGYRKPTKGIGTCPEKSGAHNITEEMIKKNQDESGSEVTRAMGELFSIAVQKRKKEIRWTPELLSQEICDYFKFCDDRNIKPAIRLLCVYLGMTYNTVYEWRKNPAKYGDLSNLIEIATESIAGQYITRGEKYPTMNQFLLKSQHGYRDSTTIEITGGQINSDNIAEAVAKLGLDKPATE